MLAALFKGPCQKRLSDLVDLGTLTAGARFPRIRVELGSSMDSMNGEHEKESNSWAVGN